MALERLGKYQLLERVGEGGTAEVFRARLDGAAGASRDVVIKRLLPFTGEERQEMEALFVSEARLSMQLTHSNLVQVFDFGQAGDQYYLVMELVDGPSLETLLEQLADRGVPALKAQVAVAITIELLKGLHAAHSKTDRDGEPLHIVHRDVSPDNVLLTRDGQVKLADFGIARARLAGRTRTEPGVFRGKMSYSPPEQLRADPLDARADVYAAGLVLWRALTGRNPQRDPVKLAMGTARLPPLPAWVPAPLANTLLQATHPELEQRLPSALAFRQRLERWLDEQPFPRRTSALADTIAFAALGDEQVPADFAQWLRNVPHPQEGAVALSSTGRELVTRPRAPVSDPPVRQDAPLAEPEPSALGEGRGLSTRAVFITAGLVSVPLAALLAWSFAENQRADSRLEGPTGPRPITTLVAPPPKGPPPARAPAAAPAPKAEAPARPRSASGVPARFTLSTDAHGLDLTSLGLKVEPPVADASWTLQLAGSGTLPPLYFASDARSVPQLLGRSVLTPRDRKGGRLFMVQPTRWSADDFTNPDLVITSRKAGAVKSTRVPRILSDVNEAVDGMSFRLSGLDLGTSYRVTTTGTRPVLVVAEGDHDGAFYLRPRPVLSVSGAPNQAFIPPGGALDVRKVLSLEFILLRDPGEPEATVDVQVTGFQTVKVERGSAEARAALPSGVPRPSSADQLASDAAYLLSNGQRADADELLDQCLTLQPDHAQCLRLKRAAK